TTAGDGRVRFTYKDYRADSPQAPKTMTLVAGEFIRRFLLHVLPAGFHDDGLRARALFPLLETANRLPGLLAIFAFSRAVHSVFFAGSQLETSQPEFAPLREFSAPRREVHASGSRAQSL